MDAYLRGIDPATVQPAEPEKLDSLVEQTISHIRPLVREGMPKLAVDLRKTTFDEVDLGYTQTQAIRETDRLPHA